MENTAVILSRQCVADMQAQLLSALNARVSAAAAETTHPQSVENALKTYLLAAQRARLRLSDTDFANLARQNATAIEEQAHCLHQDLFSPEQQSLVDIGATQRQDPAAVRALFGDATRLYLRPLDDGNRTIESRVAQFLATQDLTLADYKGGYATDGKQTFKIGRILRAHAQHALLKDFESDERRYLDRLMVVISRDPIDIARISAGRGWKSCMSPHRKEFSAFIPQEIAFGTLAVYLTRDTDLGLDNPLARTVIRAYRKVEPEIEAYKEWDSARNRRYQPLKSKFEKIKTNVKWALHGRPPGENDVLYIAEQKAYGISRGVLCHTADVFARQHLNPGISDGDYSLPWQVYTDTRGRKAVRQEGRVDIIPDPPSPY